MLRLIYTSKIAPGTDSQEIDEIVCTARDYNSTVAITGLLMSNFEYFFQILEGPDLLVRMLYEKIRQDIRHVDINLIVEEKVDHRLFPDWSMGYLTLPLEEPQNFNDDWTKLTPLECHSVLRQIIPDNDLLKKQQPERMV